MKSLYLLSRPPTGFSGREYILKQNINTLLKNNYKLTLAFSGNEDDLKSTKKLFPNAEVLLLHKINVLEVITNFFLKKKFSLQERLFYSNKNKKIINNNILFHNYDLLIVDMIRMSCLVSGVNISKKVIEYDDLLSLRYSRMLELKSDGSNLLGTYNENFPYLFSKIILKLRNKLLSYESKKIANREVEIAEDYDAVSFTSILEVENFKGNFSHPLKNKIFSNPPSVNTDIKLSNHTREKKFIFVGNLKVNHNLACLKNIINIFNCNEFIINNCTIDIIGDYDERAKDICRNSNNVYLKGRVEDLNEELQQTKYLIAPFAYGTGIKIKIIESMINNVIVVTNKIGAEGIPMIAGKHYYHCQNENDFVHFITTKISNNKTNEDLDDYITDNARKMVTEVYSNKVVETNFIDFIS